ncbi:hypothetical protein ACFXGT_35225 [Streptomyces sp. NPDC059352]|uniref:hypothetical protein n=1 Tax=Streptomyces sp. NPDC059352 TaxID=3346810 RepID=UPI0036D0D2C7
MPTVEQTIVKGWSFSRRMRQTNSAVEQSKGTFSLASLRLTTALSADQRDRLMECGRPVDLPEGTHGHLSWRERAVSSASCRRRITRRVKRLPVVNDIGS